MSVRTVHEYPVSRLEVFDRAGEVTRFFDCKPYTSTGGNIRTSIAERIAAQNPWAFTRADPGNLASFEGNAGMPVRQQVERVNRVRFCFH